MVMFSKQQSYHRVFQIYFVFTEGRQTISCIRRGVKKCMCGEGEEKQSWWGKIDQILGFKEIFAIKGCEAAFSYSVDVIKIHLPLWGWCIFFKAVVEGNSGEKLYLAMKWREFVHTWMHCIFSHLFLFQFQREVIPPVAFAVSSRWENPHPNLWLSLGESSSCFIS